MTGSISTTTAVVILVAWTVVPLAAGAWRTATREAWKNAQSSHPPAPSSQPHSRSPAAARAPATNPLISGTSTGYYKALADHDYDTACGSLAAAKIARFNGSQQCATTLAAALADADTDTLRNLANGKSTIDVNGATATVIFSATPNRTLRLRRASGDWRINSGYAVP